MGLNINNTEAWWYSGNAICFKGNMYYPSLDQRNADIAHAMDSQSFKDPLPSTPQAYYSAAFARPDGNLDLEVYQSLRVDDSGVAEPPLAKMALYDRSLAELARDSSLVRGGALAAR